MAPRDRAVPAGLRRGVRGGDVPPVSTGVVRGQGRRRRTSRRRGMAGGGGGGDEDRRSGTAQWRLSFRGRGVPGARRAVAPGGRGRAAEEGGAAPREARGRTRLADRL